jgi:dihydrofolate synthase/folylpolyglutamate synthase
VAVPGQFTSLGAEEAAAMAARHGLPTSAAPNIREALHLLAARSDGSARVLICGSLYLAGAVLAENEAT